MSIRFFLAVLLVSAIPDGPLSVASAAADAFTVCMIENIAVKNSEVAFCPYSGSQPHGQPCTCHDGVRGTAVTLHVLRSAIPGQQQTDGSLTTSICIHRDLDNNNPQLQACGFPAYGLNVQNNTCICKAGTQSGRVFNATLFASRSPHVSSTPPVPERRRPIPDFFGDRPPNYQTIDAGAQNDFLKRLRECCRQ